MQRGLQRYAEVHERYVEGVGKSVGRWRGVQMCDWRYGRCVEVYKGAWRCADGHRDKQRCTEVHRSMCKCVEGCVEV